LLALVLKTTSCARLPMTRVEVLENPAPKVKVKVPDAGPLMVVVAVRTIVDV